MKTNEQQPCDKKNWTKTLPEGPGGKYVFDGMITPEEQRASASTSRSNSRLFNDGKAPSHRLPRKLLQSVARGEQEKAASILKASPYLLSHRGDVTDYSGRTFKNITAFQYALWAMDTHMCRMILDAIPPGPTGGALRTDLIRQYEELETYGVAYELEGQTHTNQHHFDFSTLIDALQNFIDSRGDLISHTRPPNWTEVQRLWCTTVGQAQRYVPAHVAQEYCHPTRSFWPTSSLFKEHILKRSLTFSGGIQWWETEASSEVVLGVHFGISRGSKERADMQGYGDGIRMGTWQHVGPRDKTPNLDLVAMQTLCEVRTADLKDTLEILEREPNPSCCMIS